MLTKFARVLSFALLLCPLYSQTPSDPQVDRTFHFEHATTVQDMQEIATVIRAVGGIGQVGVKEEQRLLTVHATAGQTMLAAWIFQQLDIGVPGANALPAKYLMNGNDPANVVQVSFVPNTATPQALQEVATAVRSTLDIRRMFTCTATRAIVSRGTADQMSAAQWMLTTVDVPAQATKLSNHTYELQGVSQDRAIGVFFLKNVSSVQNFQEVAVTTRAIGDIRRLFTYNAPRAIMIRGTAEQIQYAGWMLNQLDNPAIAASTAKREYVLPAPGDPENIVRVFSLKHAASGQRLQDVAVEVRTSTGVRRLFTYHAPSIIAVRGTPSQVEQASQLIQQLDQ